MKKWEYCVCDEKKIVKELGLEGWELVSVLETKMIYNGEIINKYYFKREIL